MSHRPHFLRPKHTLAPGVEHGREPSLQLPAGAVLAGGGGVLPVLEDAGAERVSVTVAREVAVGRTTDGAAEEAEGANSPGAFEVVGALLTGALLAGALLAGADGAAVG